MTTNGLGDAVYHETMREPHCQRIRVIGDDIAPRAMRLPQW
jgi:hypothetical protein